MQPFKRFGWPTFSSIKPFISNDAAPTDNFTSQAAKVVISDREIMFQCATGLEHIHSLG